MSKNEDLMEKIDSAVSDVHHNRHSYFQLQYFVIGKEPTHQARLMSCKRELLDRKQCIESLNSMLEDLHDQKLEMEIELGNFKAIRQSQIAEGDENNLKTEVAIRRRNRAIASVVQKIHDIQQSIACKEEEANFILSLYNRLCETEGPKDWDSLPVQLEYWNAKLTRELETQLLLGRPSEATFASIQSLPDIAPVKVHIKELIHKQTEKINEKR